MYFYTIDDEEHKLYMSITIGKKIITREDLEYYYDIHCEKCRKYITFSRNDIIAEQSTGKFPILASAILGCFMFGLLSGAAGALIGFIIGIIAGQYIVKKEEYDVEVFNKSG